jgi:LAGLIDADG endonuclease
MKLDAGWITGFVDGEGCFFVGINAHAEMTAGIQILPEFTVVQHERDVQVLHALKSFFGCGVVRRNHGDRMAFRVRSKEDLLRHVIPFFDKHPLKSKKHIDYLKFRDVLILMERGEHLTKEGVAKIRKIASEMNRGSTKIKSSSLGNQAGTN